MRRDERQLFERVVSALEDLSDRIEALELLEAKVLFLLLNPPGTPQAVAGIRLVTQTIDGEPMATTFNVGQTATAVVQEFDASGSLVSPTQGTVSLVSTDPSIVTVTDGSFTASVAAVSVGSASVTATVVVNQADGSQSTFTASEDYTVEAVVPPVQVVSSIAIQSTVDK